MRGKSFLVTYNRDFYGRPFPDGTAVSATEDALWNRAMAWSRSLVTELGITRETLTLEQSLHSRLEGRVHIHWKIDLEESVDWEDSTRLAFHGLRPGNVRKTLVPGAKAARGLSQRTASDRGHFYCYADKTGTLRVHTNHYPWRDYKVLGKWVDDLWAEHKLDHGVYAAYSVKCRKGHAARMRDIAAVREDEAQKAIAAEVEQRREQLAGLMSPFRAFPAVSAWEATFLRVRPRYRFLILHADSRAGKTSFAESLFRNPFVVTVEDNPELDLKGFDRAAHDGVVLDNCNTFGQLLKWRALLQARNTLTKGGQSATQMYAYSQYLFMVPIVVTVDFDAKDDYLMDAASARRSKWLLLNAVYLRLEAGRAFYEAGPEVVGPEADTLFARQLRARGQAGGT